MTAGTRERPPAADPGGVSKHHHRAGATRSVYSLRVWLTERDRNPDTVAERATDDAVAAWLLEGVAG